MKRKRWSILVLALAAAVLCLAFSACQPKEGTAPAPIETAVPAEEPVKVSEASPVSQTPAPEPSQSPYPDAIDFSFTDGDGKEYKLSDFYGKPTIINFFATWCPPCRAELPYFDAAFQSYSDRINFLVLDLVDSDSETVQNGLDFMASNGYSFPLYFDSNFEGYDAYGSGYVPVTVLISSNGGLVDSHIGGLSRGELQEMIIRLLDS